MKMDGGILMFHLDSARGDALEICKEIISDFPKIQAIAVRNNTDFIEGCTLLKMGFKGYISSISHPNIFNQAIEVVQNGNIWVYPELMQFMIGNITAGEKGDSAMLEHLTQKEREVSLLVSQGMSNAQIAKTLDVAEVTVKKYLSSIFAKTGTKDRLALALFVKKTHP